VERKNWGKIWKECAKKSAFRELKSCKCLVADRLRRKAGMTRFQILEKLAAYQNRATVQNLQRAFGLWKESSAESIRKQLERMTGWGLVSRRQLRWRRGVSYCITMRGRERLIWARKKGLI
jgi:predicted transcriptional regulator